MKFLLFYDNSFFLALLFSDQLASNHMLTAKLTLLTLGKYLELV